MQREFRGPSGGALAHARFETPWSTLEDAAATPPTRDYVAAARFDLAPIFFGNASTSEPGTAARRSAPIRVVAERFQGPAPRRTAQGAATRFDSTASPSAARSLRPQSRRSSGVFRVPTDSRVVRSGRRGVERFGPERSLRGFAPERFQAGALDGWAPGGSETRRVVGALIVPGRAASPFRAFDAPSAFISDSGAASTQRAGNAEGPPLRESRRLSASPASFSPPARKEPPRAFPGVAERFASSKGRTRRAEDAFVSSRRTSTREGSSFRFVGALERVDVPENWSRRAGTAFPGVRTRAPSAESAAFEARDDAPSGAAGASVRRKSFRSGSEGATRRVEPAFSEFATRRGSSRIRAREEDSARADAFFAPRLGRRSERLPFPGLDSLAQRVRAHDAARRSSGAPSVSRPSGLALAPPSQAAFAGTSEPLDLSLVEKLLKESRDALVTLASVARNDMTLDVEN